MPTLARTQTDNASLGSHASGAPGSTVFAGSTSPSAGASATGGGSGSGSGGRVTPVPLSTTPTATDVAPSFSTPTLPSGPDVGDTDAQWREMQNTLTEVEMSATKADPLFAAEHLRALDMLRAKQFVLAQAWARSEVDEVVEDREREREKEKDKGAGVTLATSAAGAVAGPGSGAGPGQAQSPAAKGKGMLDPTEFGVPSPIARATTTPTTPGLSPGLSPVATATTSGAAAGSAMGAGLSESPWLLSREDKMKNLMLADEKTKREMLLARKRREANDRYFERMNSAVVDVVTKLDEVAMTMTAVERQSQAIWNESESSVSEST